MKAYCLTIIAYWCLRSTVWSKDDDYDNLDLKIKGDIVLGGLFPVHEDAKSSGKQCGAIKADKGVQRLEAMIFALREINKNGTLLPGVTLGAHILDTCNQDTQALQQTLKFIKNSLSQNNMEFYHCTNNQTIINNAPLPVTAVIGAASSQVSSMVANVLRLFKIPQISYSSTSPELSDKSRFQYFSRVVPPDNLQARAMVDVVKKLHWTYVSGIFDEGSYGEQGIEAFVKHASEKGVCIASRHKLKRDFKDEDYRDVILELNKMTHRGVVLFANEDNVKKLLRAVDVVKPSKPFAWVASDNWGTKRSAVQDHPLSAIGAITIQPKMKIIPAFDDYFKALNPNNTEYPWFLEYWQHEFNCTSLNAACLNNTLSRNHIQEVYVPFVIDAVYLAAYAINNLLRDNCKGQSYTKCISSSKFQIDGPTLLHYIRTTEFIGMQNEEVRLNENGDRMIRYDIHQFRMPDKHYVEVGEWVMRGDSDSRRQSSTKLSSYRELSLNLPLIKSGFNKRQIPESNCGKKCLDNEYQSRTHVGCCWQCIFCNESSIMPNKSICINCQLGFLPNAFKNECIPMVPQMTEWNSPFAIVPACFSAIGIVATLMVVNVFIRHNRTPVIMASGRELCYIMLSGIFACYAMTFVLLNPPARVVCGLLRVGLGLCLCIIYSAILTKTSRLSRIFTSNVQAMRSPKFISPGAQLIICGGLISVQLFGSIVWLIVDPPNVTKLYPDRITEILSCAVTAQPLLFSFLYIAILIVLCTVYAFKTRKIPENFNETQHIGFTMYATCVIWLAFVPIYFSTNNNFRMQTTSLCMCLSLSGTVALCCFFAPKVFLVLFQPEKNVRGSMGGNLKGSGNQKVQIGCNSQQMRFLKNSSHEPTTNASQFSTNIESTMINTISLNSMKSEATTTNDDLNSSDQRSLSPSLAKSSIDSGRCDNHAKLQLPLISGANKHVLDSATVNEESSAVDTSALLTDSTSATPLLQMTNGRRRDWILVDPQKEFEAILTKISDQKGTFV